MGRAGQILERGIRAGLRRRVELERRVRRIRRKVVRGRLLIRPGV